MLDNLRSGAHGVFGKILLGLLVLSFGIWGIGDIFRSTAGGSANVATVGNSKISYSEFRHALRNRQEQLQRQMGKSYSAELMKKLHLDLIVRDELINAHLINNAAADMGINVGDEAVIDSISKNPAFFGKDGKFDKEVYLAVLSNHGINEQRYITDLRENLAAKILAGTVTGGVAVPSEFALAIYKSENEQRIANITIVPASAKASPAPTEDEIKAYYNTHANLFQTTELRTISYVNIRIADLQPKMDVSDDDVKHVYEERIDDFRKPERRQVEQLLFNEQADADKVAQKLTHGEKFSDLARTANITNKGKTSLGAISKQDLPADDANAVFNLKEGAATKPLKSDFGWHIFYVSKIIPESTATLAQAKPDIVKEISSAKAMETATRLANQVVDDMAGGASLEDAAKKAGFKTVTISNITRDTKAPTVPNYDSFIGTAFSVAEKEHSQAVQAQDGSYFIIRTDSVTPEHTRPLPEIKDKIVATLQKEKTEKLMRDTADDVAAKLQAGKKPDIAVMTLPSGNLKHDSQTIEGSKTPLAAGLVADIFVLPQGGTTHAYKAANGDYMIATLTKIIPAPANPDQKQLTAIAEQLKTPLENEALEDYLYYLRGKYSVSVNNAIFTLKDDEGGE